MVLSVMQISFTKRKVHLVYIALGVVSMLLAGVSYVRAAEAVEGTPVRAESAQVRRTALSTDHQNRFINLVRNTTSRMEGAIERLTQIASRIDARVSELDAKGVNTQLAREPLSEAQAKLGEAQTRLAAAKKSAEDGIVSETPRERFTIAREEFRVIRDLTRESFILLREALAELKDAVMEAELNSGASAAVLQGAVRINPIINQ